jgi:redox-sensitive bicupin YhaK (pirin superfamily)
MSNQRRAVANTIKPQPVLEGAGVRLKRSFPIPDLDYLDPFLFFDDFSSGNSDDHMKGFPLVDSEEDVWYGS